MSLEDIKALPIGELAAKDCALFMWITFPCMQEAFQAVSYTHLDGYQVALQSQQRREIKIKRYARVIEGHILDFKPGKRRRS